MNNGERRRITVSRDEITIITKMQGKALATCLPCRRQVEMATPEQAVTLTGIHSRVIYGWVEGGRVHFIETTDGHLLICLDSLRAAYEDSLRETQERVSPYRRAAQEYQQRGLQETQELASSGNPLLPFAETEE